MASRASSTAPTPPRSPGPVVPSGDDPVVRRGSELVGGPVGRRARLVGGWWTPVRVAVVVTVVSMLLGVVKNGYCRAIGWPRGTNLEFAHACYSDIPHLFLERGLATGEIPFLDYVPGGQGFEYPTLTGLIAWLPTLVSGPDQRLYVDVNTLVLTVCALVVVIATARTAGLRRWDGVLVAAAPSLALAGIINWDLFAVALAALALLAWARRHPLLAGVLIGLGTSAKLYPVFFLGPILVLCLRSGRMRAFWTATGGAAVAWLVTNVPVAVENYAGWLVFWKFNGARGAEFGSPWYGLQQAGVPVPNSLVGVLAPGLFLVGCALVAWLGWRAPRRPRLAQLVFLVIAAFLVTNKVYSPQYVLWLLPLAVLARPRVRDLAIWQACEVFYFFLIWLNLAGASDTKSGLYPGWYSFAVLVRVAGTGYLAWTVVRDVLEPERDPVRADCVDDPSGGVLDGAPDVRPALPAPEVEPVGADR